MNPMPRFSATDYTDCTDCAEDKETNPFNLCNLWQALDSPFVYLRGFANAQPAAGDSKAASWVRGRSASPRLPISS
jgi:hypothetical protein